MTDNRTHVVAQAATLSSGTIATMTGHNRYKDIERVQRAFVEFCQDHPQYERWQDAWTKFQIHNEKGR